MISITKQGLKFSQHFGNCKLIMRNSKLITTKRFLTCSPVLSSRYESPMPNSYYTAEQQEMQRSLLKIIENDINPYIDEWEAKEQFPSHQIFKKLGENGFLGVQYDTEYGGLGLDYKYQAAILEELGNINCGSIPMAIGVQTDMAVPALARFGSDELKKQFLVPTIAGDFVAAIGVSEVSAGSDVAGIKTTAVRKGDDYIINGSKCWITNGMKADWICLLVNTVQGGAHKNKSLICVPLNSPGISRTKIHKLGMLSSDTAQLTFEDVRVPIGNVIGEENAGFFYQMVQFQSERLAGCLMTLKSFDKLLSNTIEYTEQRKAFGKSILDNQVVHFRLGELATEVEALRALTYKAVDMMVAGEDVTRLASMAKLKAGRLSREIADSCLQYWGGMGYTKEVLVSRSFRDGRLMSIGGGADEIMLEIICKLMNISRSRK